MELSLSRGGALLLTVAVGFLMLGSLLRLDNALGLNDAHRSTSIPNPLRVVVVDRANVNANGGCPPGSAPTMAFSLPSGADADEAVAGGGGNRHGNGKSKSEPTPSSTSPHITVCTSVNSVDLAAFHQEADVNVWTPRGAYQDGAVRTSEESGQLVKKYAGAPGSAGQVREENTFGQALRRLASRPDVRRMIEIGTWYGQGSTAVIGRAFKSTRGVAEQIVSRPSSVSESSAYLFERSSERRNGSKFLWTLEIFEPAWQHARQFMAKEQLPVRCIFGGTVPSVDVLPPSAVEESEKSNPNSHYSQYYARDVALIQEMEPWLLPLCTVHAPLDAVLIDGNEYTGWAEYLVVDAVCKPRFLALHDANTLKTRKIEQVIANGDTPWLLWESGHDAVKWDIYVHKDYKQTADQIGQQ